MFTIKYNLCNNINNNFMRIGIYKGKEVKVYEDGDKFIVEFNNGISITLETDDEITYKD